jgi:hypothetical protein
VVVLFPDGLAGLWNLVRKKIGPIIQKSRIAGSSLVAAEIDQSIVKGEKP